MIISGNEPAVIEHLITILSSHGVVIMPCDTIYGFVGICPGTGERIQNIKGREDDKPLLVLTNLDNITNLTEQKIPEKFTRCWPGPLTLIVKKKGTDETIAVRVPDDQILLKLIARLGSPLYSTSVNRSGEPPLNDIEVIVEEFENDVDLIIDGGNIERGVPSTIVDVTTRPFKIIREGKLKIEL